MKGTVAPPSSSATAAATCCGRTFSSAASWATILSKGKQGVSCEAAQFSGAESGHRRHRQETDRPTTCRLSAWHAWRMDIDDFEAARPEMGRRSNPPDQRGPGASPRICAVLGGIEAEFIVRNRAEAVPMSWDLRCHPAPTRCGVGTGAPRPRSVGRKVRQPAPDFSTEPHFSVRRRPPAFVAWPAITDADDRTMQSTRRLSAIPRTAGRWNGLQGTSFMHSIVSPNHWKDTASAMPILVGVVSINTALIVVALCGMQGALSRLNRGNLILWLTAVAAWLPITTNAVLTVSPALWGSAALALPLVGSIVAWLAIRRLSPTVRRGKFTTSLPRSTAFIGAMGLVAPQWLSASVASACWAGSLLALALCTGDAACRQPDRRMTLRVLSLAVWLAVGAVAAYISGRLDVRSDSVTGLRTELLHSAGADIALVHAWLIALTSLFLGLHHDHEHRAALAMARRDVLTGLNRRCGQMSQLRERRLRQGEEIAVVMLDIDHFKSINDQHGHTTGDLVLSHFGQLIRNAVRDADLASRYGGEEFCVILEGTEAAGALAVAQRIVEATRRTPVRVPGGLVLSFTVSAGFAMGRLDRLDDCIRRADAALYLAKRQGRNRAVGCAGPIDATGAGANALRDDAPQFE